MELSKKKGKFGDMLVANGMISDQQLKLALSEQVSTGKKIGQTLVDLGFVDEDQLAEVQAQQMGLQVAKLTELEPKLDCRELMAEALARRYRAVVIEASDAHIVLGMADPSDIFALDELQNLFDRPVTVQVVRDSDLNEYLDRAYKNEVNLSSIAIELETELGFEEELELDADLDVDDASDAPVFRLIQSIFDDAITARASDIHIEPDESVLRIRMRVDGTLQEKIMKEKRIAPALVMRLKIMSSLDISEKRKPQDGRFPMSTKNKAFDVRISTLPTQFGESVVMRILDQSALKLDLAEIGMPVGIMRRFEILIK